MGEILLTGEEAQEGAALEGDVITNGAAEHGIARLERVEHGGKGNRRGDGELHLNTGAGERAEVVGEFDADDGC